MFRALGIFGLAAGFVAISPNLREWLSEALTSGVGYLNTHSPYSYLISGVVAFACLALLARSACASR